MRLQRAGTERCPQREGITLLEIVLALGLMAIAMTLLAQLVFIGNRAARDARDLSKAQLYCESVMSEVVVGIRTPDSVSLSPLDADLDWLYSIDVGTTSSETLSAVRVTVQQNTESARPTTFTMTQWISSASATTTDDATGDAL